MLKKTIIARKMKNKINIGKKILLLGASSDMGLALLDRLNISNFTLGAHCYKGKKRIINWIKLKDKKIKFKIMKKNLKDQKSCYALVDEFIKWSGGIDVLIQLNGNISSVVYWDQLKEQDWRKDIAINLGAPFFVAQKAFGHMKKKGGKVILMSTASAKHGGGCNTMGYGIAKAGVEAFTKGMAREGGKYNILVNAIAPGLIKTRFHKEKAGKTSFEIKKRANLSRLKRIGEPNEIAAVIKHLISDDVNYITGETISVSGGDWI